MKVNDGEQAASEESGVEEQLSAGLSELEASILEFERGWWKYGQTRDAAIRNRMNMTPMRYHLMLAHMLDSERVWHADPALVDRLRRLRDARLAEWRGE
ncbi:DUF3263 domain-containing protein [Trueperella bialowiezensis]|uniref:Protein of uncharacterized function (DUF3263) n=1 Tax=Trueperella bialowiezensis TaxID=312285 RepID=A0A3S4VFP7_9ACTO|nr:DUF3263 domain-containing protein [Trueperella bialowiezensis]VEI13104.1 Protein of uncharacterised function (DUF3263) [Trueperella bialowiezensis]